MTVCFFGHRSIIEKEVEPGLNCVLLQLINEGECEFLVGHQGQFDLLVIKTLEQMQLSFPQLNFYIVLAYMPGPKKQYQTLDYSRAFFPEGLESAPARFAIPRRNRWMIDNSNIVVTYCTHHGGAHDAMLMARHKGKRVINLSEQKWA